MMAKRASVMKSVEQSNADKSELVTLGNGVVLLIRKISPSLMMEMYEKYSEEPPSPPRYYIENLGREEENPDDPEYLEALRLYKTRQSRKMSDAFLVLGTRLHSCPRNIPKPDSDGEWVENLVVLDLDHFDNKRARYLMWLKSVALEDEDDFQKVLTAVGRKSGVREEDVQKAAESFRGDEKRDTD